jgi:hypothetical protein
MDGLFTLFFVCTIVGAFTFGFGVSKTLHQTQNQTKVIIAKHP